MEKETYKATIRIPTEQYAFVEISTEGTSEEIAERHYEFTKLLSLQEGLPRDEFNDALDRYLTDGTGETETYVAMSSFQKGVFQEIKKAFKRIKRKNGEEVED